MEKLIENVSITTFVSPHLFWVIESKNECRSKTLSDLKVQLRQLVENDSTPADDDFEVGQV